MKRFWSDVSLDHNAAGIAVLLDGKPVKLPGGGSLAVPGQTLAEALQDEWRAAGGAKGGDFSAEDISLTRLAGTAIERIAPDRDATVTRIAAYGETDLLCYRAQEPPSLADAQMAAWQPWLDWAAAHLQARLLITTALTRLDQPKQALSALRAAVAAYDEFALAGLGLMVPALGSLILGLAVADGHLSPESGHEIAALEELFQARKWGEDDLAATRRKGIAQDIALASRFIALARA